MIEGYEYYPEETCPYCDEPLRVQRYTKGIKFVCPPCDYTKPDFYTWPYDYPDPTKFGLKVKK